MKLYAVIHTTGGFAREDAAQPAITGIYQDPEVAEKVKRIVSGDGKVVPIELDFIPPGYLNSAAQLGIKF